MSKFLQVFSRQNPKFEVACNNPKCRKKFSVKTIDILSSDNFVAECPYCKESNTYTEGKSFLKSIEDEYKKAGFSID